MTHNKVDHENLSSEPKIVEVIKRNYEQKFEGPYHPENKDGEGQIQ